MHPQWISLQGVIVQDSILAVETVRAQVGTFFATINLGAPSVTVTNKKRLSSASLHFSY